MNRADFALFVPCKSTFSSF